MSNPERSVPQNGNWDEDFKDNENGGNSSANPNQRKLTYMDMKNEGVYVFRLVGPHIKCRKSFKPYKATVQDTEKENSPAWKAGWFPPKRYAINVIDRADGQLKILEKGASVFKHFAEWKAAFGKDPAGKDGPDFRLTVKIPKHPNGTPNKLKTEYSVMPLKEAPFTDADKKVIFKTDEKGNILRAEPVGAEKVGKPVSNLWPLKDIYKSTSAVKMQEMWNALSDAEKVPPKREKDEDDDDTPKSEKAEPVTEKMAEAPADSKDLFETENTDEPAF